MGCQTGKFCCFFFFVGGKGIREQCGQLEGGMLKFTGSSCLGCWSVQYIRVLTPSMVPKTLTLPARTAGVPEPSALGAQLPVYLPRGLIQQ